MLVEVDVGAINFWHIGLAVLAQEVIELFFAAEALHQLVHIHLGKLGLLGVGIH